jgi:hypothetical protein
MTNPEIFGGAAGGPAFVTPDWTPENAYWRAEFGARRYAQADRGYEYFEPGYRYGFESAHRYRGRQWGDVESDLERGWEKYEHRGESTWEHIKDAVRDAWDRVTGHRRDTARE